MQRSFQDKVSDNKKAQAAAGWIKPSSGTNSIADSVRPLEQIIDKFEDEGSSRRDGESDRGKKLQNYIPLSTANELERNDGGQLKNFTNRQSRRPLTAKRRPQHPMSTIAGGVSNNRLNDSFREAFKHTMSNQTRTIANNSANIN